ncbi:hypothetical protein L915_18609 [Phytophthora nicotianae]|uniref:Fe2OG dioxygenase domain-containing protein n=1 Tax=Phytophthora nicotianae TaxID=4792 RepID=W2FXF8_PHYNI|nr:hypothetical protein L915_18609 [Phytophthora nicotianae]
MGNSPTKRQSSGQPSAPGPPPSAIRKGVLSVLTGRPPLVCTFYYESQVFTHQIQLPLLYDRPQSGTQGTALVDLEVELRKKLQLPEGSSVFAVVQADELYSPPYPLVMINIVAARLFTNPDETRIPVLHYALVVRHMGLLKQPLPMGNAYESPFFAVNAAALAETTNSIARNLARRRFVQNLQTFGFARLEVTPEQAKIPQLAFERVRKWLVEQLELPKEKRWIDYVDVSKPGEKESVEDNSLYSSHPVVSRGRRVGFSLDRNREYMQLRLPIAASGTPWPPVYFQDSEENKEFANELLTLLELLDDISRDCMKSVCEILNIDERWLFDDLLDDRTRPTEGFTGPRNTSYQYGASVLRIYNYRNKAANGQSPADVDPNDYSCGVHADLGLVTVSPVATVPGLQMWNLERMNWADVEENATALHFSVFAGETLGLLTHGVISAPLHRVPPICVEIEAEIRMSMPYFLRAKPSACLNPKAPKVEQITCRDFMEDIVFKKRPWRREKTVGAGPFFLQLRGFAKFVTPHKISENLITPADAVQETTDLLNLCPATVMVIAGARWNACPTHYYRIKNGVRCHFTVPQYNAHGNYVMMNHTVMPHDTSSSSCADHSFPLEGNFYHGSIGYYSIYAAASGTFCSLDNTTYLRVSAVGTYDTNGSNLAYDRGEHGYRKSYWYILTGTAFILVRCVTLRRSFVSCKIFARRCDCIVESIRIQEAVVYVQESMRLSAHGARNFHRLLLLFLLIDQGVMSDFFLLSTQEGLLGRIQSISLGYNLSGVMSMLFEMVETMNWMSEKMRCQAKRLLFNYETVLIGELITAGVLQHYLTSLSRSHLRDTEPAAEMISHYVMGLVGHIVLALGCLGIIVATRAIGAIVFVKLQFGTLRVLTNTCSVDAALGARSKLILLSGYIWENEELYYKPSVLKALGVLKAVDPDGYECFVHTQLHWIAIPQDNLVVLGTVANKRVEPCPERLCSGVVSLFDHTLGGSAGNVLGDEVARRTQTQDCYGVFRRFRERVCCSSEVTPGPTPAKIKVRAVNDEQVSRQVLPAWEAINQHLLKLPGAPQLQPVESRNHLTVSYHASLVSKSCNHPH